MGTIMLAMTKLCATDGCTDERVTGNKGTDAYCRQHKNEIARKMRAAGKGPEVFAEQVCANVDCDIVFKVSSWGQFQRYHSPECRDGAPKAARAAARAERQKQRAHELATMTEKFCPGVRASDDEPEELCGMRPVEDFYSAKGRLDSLCKEHRKMVGRRYDAANPGTRREGKRVSSLANRLSKYSYKGRPMTLEDRDAELASNNFMCHDCGKVPATDVDHDHKTMKYRGMLCRGCNLVLGSASSDSELEAWVKHIEYIHRAEQKGIPFPVGYQPLGPALCATCDERPPEPDRRFCRECRNATEAEARRSRKDSLRGRPCAREGCPEPRFETASQVVSYCIKHWRERSAENRLP